MRYGTALVLLDEVELEYLVDLVQKDQLLGGALIGIDVLGNLAEAMDHAKEMKDGIERAGRDSTSTL